ncbi:MAG: hypothetical protein HPY50_04865 [Firmicutes bacterium]|nr:hypothetical protein [Bacillota bacterium]
MRIIEQGKTTELRVIGQMSDQSDRQEIEVTNYWVKVENEDKFYMLTFDHAPIEEEITSDFDAGKAVEVITIEDLSAKLAEARAALRAAEDAILVLLGI